jgi:Cof subfamily protein (haloacid dehalogenase superfamily)
VIRLLAVDIDGTLLDSRGRVPDSHRRALGEAAARGVTIALATGRSFHSTRPIAEALELPVTMIVNNGAMVKSEAGATLLRRLLSRDAALAILAGTRAFEDSVAVVFDRSDHRQIVFEHMDWTHPHRQGYYDRNKAFISETSPLVEAITEDPVQVMFTGGVVRMRALAGWLRAMPIADRVSVALTEYELRDFALVDVNDAGCSKGSTLAQWAAASGVVPDEVMAVGDNLNDVEMLDFAGTAVVMANAAEGLRARGFHLAASNDENGLAAAIDEFILSTPTRSP